MTLTRRMPFPSVATSRRNWRARLPLVLVLALATVLRVYRIGLYPVTWDEVNLLFRSYRLGRFGDWLWLSPNPTTWGTLPGHSPLSNYLIAFIDLFTTSAFGVRVVTALMGVGAVALVYAMVDRYVGRRAALLASLLLATSTLGVEWSRFVWNPNFAQLFIALWAFTGLLGYVDGRRYAQAAHWLLLSLALQFHPANALLALPSLLCLLFGWRTRGRLVLAGTLAGWALAVLALVPWLIGLIDAGFFAAPIDLSSGAAREESESLATVFATVSSVVGATTFNTTARGSPTPGDLWPPLWTDTLLALQTVTALLGAVALIPWSLRDLRTRFPMLLFASITLTPLLAFAVSPVQEQGYYLMAILYGAMPVLGIALDRMLSAHRIARLAAAGMLVVWIGLHLALIAGNLRWLDLHGWQQPLRAPLDTFTTAVNQWHQMADDVVILVDTPEVKYSLPDMQIAFWSVARDGQPAHIINRFFGQGVPLGPGTTLVAGFAESATLARLFDDTRFYGQLADGTPVFRYAIVERADEAALQFTPGAVDRFANGARILGVSADQPPSAGETWPITLVWQPQRDAADANYQFSVRLVGADDRVYGQQDFTSLDLAHWRRGDTVLNPVDIAVSDDLPDDAQPRIQVLMYTLPDIRNSDALDADGNVAGPWLYLNPVAVDAATAAIR